MQYYSRKNSISLFFLLFYKRSERNLAFSRPNNSFFTTENTILPENASNWRLLPQGFGHLMRKTLKACGRVNAPNVEHWF